MMSGTPGKSKTTRHESLVGRALCNGEYQVQAVLGHGGMGQVFLASHASIDVPLALKQGRADQPLPESVVVELDAILHGSDATHRTSTEQANYFPSSGGAQTDRFVREALLLARLQHPAMPTLYDYFFEDGYWYIVMDYIPGSTLAAYIRQYAPLPPLEALNYALQLCDVLEYLHKQSPPVIFRDLKPSNVILAPDGRLVLIDFGIARYFKAGQMNDTTDFGSHGYASPEQYQNGGQTDGRSDLFSLGVMLHEMISGRQPAEKLASLQHINPAISSVLSGLVTVATRPEPRHRFQSAHTFYLALERAYTIEERRAYLVEVHSVGQEKVKETRGGESGDIEHRPLWSPVVGGLTRMAPGSEGNGGQPQGSPPDLSPHPPLRPKRASAKKLTHERPLVRTSNSHMALRIIQTAFILALILFLVMTPFFLYGRFSHQVSTSTVPKSQPGPGYTTPESSVVAPNSSWQILPSLPSPEADNTTVYVQVEGRAYIYMSGGYRGAERSPNYDRGLYRYDIAAAHWETVMNKNFPSMVNNAVALDEQNDLFFTGGYSPDTHAVTSLLYKYQPSDGTLQKIVPPAQIPIGFGAAMIADQQGHLYITQGFMQAGNPHVLASTGWYRYDINNQQWHTLAPLPTGLGYVVLASDGRGSILLFGGSTDAGQSSPTEQVYRYNI